MKAIKTSDRTTSLKIMDYRVLVPAALIITIIVLVTTDIKAAKRSKGLEQFFNKPESVEVLPVMRTQRVRIPQVENSDSGKALERVEQ
jgi:hypothetical protein